MRIRAKTLAVARLRQVAAFTLIEILIVLVIVTIVTMIAVLKFGGANQGRQLKTAALRIKQVLVVAQTKAILQPAILGLVVTDRGYQFMRFVVTDTNKSAGQWQQVADDRLSQAELPGGIQVSLDVHANHSLLASSGLADNTPHVVFYPSGQVTPFQLTLSHLSVNKRYQINVDEDGSIKLD